MPDRTLQYIGPIIRHNKTFVVGISINIVIESISGRSYVCEFICYHAMGVTFDKILSKVAHCA